MPQAAGFGKQFGHGLGHGIGLATHELPALSRHAPDAVLPSPTVFSVEPGIYLEDETGVRIDDVGAEKTSEWVLEQLYAIVNTRYEDERSIVITTNRPVGAWGEILGDTTVAAAMLDRLLHRSVVITLDGASYRLRHHATAADELRRVTTGTNLR